MNLFRKIIIITVILGGQISLAASLYDLQSKWIDTDNKEVSINVNMGSYTLIGMVYTSCPHACPMTISKIQKIEKDFSAIQFKKLKIVLASFDVKNDRPEKLKKYQESRKLDSAKWTFLAAKSDSDARELAVALGISYKDLGDGDFSHSNVITLLDPDGQIIASIDNLNASSETLIKALQNSLKKIKK
jgi:protein SCO1/2